MVLKYEFDKSLKEGLIKSRPNRFIMFVELEGELVKCHCPVTGRIGEVVFSDVPCLLSESDNPDRKTRYTVEAISLDPRSKKEKEWIGINQTSANRYVEFFLKKGALSEMVSGEVQRERMLGKSRIDFLVDKSYVEVKMPLISFPMKAANEKAQHSKFNSFDRLIKHFGDLSKHLKTGERSIILLCFEYDAHAFIPPKSDDNNKEIIKAARRASRAGVENWQINLKIDEEGISLIKYFKLNLF